MSNRRAAKPAIGLTILGAWLSTVSGKPAMPRELTWTYRLIGG